MPLKPQKQKKKQKEETKTKDKREETKTKEKKQNTLMTDTRIKKKAIFVKTFSKQLHL